MKEHDYARPYTTVVPGKPVDDSSRQIEELKRKLQATQKELRVTKKILKRREKSLTTLANKLVEMSLITEDQNNVLTTTYSSKCLNIFHEQPS